MSKLMLFDWLCPEHGEFEEMAKPDVRQIPCPQCSRTSDRQISAVRIDVTGMALRSGATPTSIDHFERIHRERKAIEERTFREHGDYGTHAGSDGGTPVTQDVASSL